MRIRSLINGMINGRVRVTKGEVLDCNEPDAIYGSMLAGEQNTARQRLSFQCQILGSLSNRGKRCLEALKKYDRDADGQWGDQSLEPAPLFRFQQRPF